MSGEIVRKETVSMVPIVDGCARPNDLEGAFRIAKLFHATGMLPQGVNTPEQAMVALMAGMECGLSPTQSLQNVMVVNKRPTVWGDAAIGLVWASGKMESHTESIEGEGDRRAGVCVVKRKGDAQPYSVRFSVDDAKKANLWGKAGPWSQYPDRMLKLRARAFAIRDKFADVLKGLGIREEVDDYETTTRRVEVVTSSKPSLADRLDAANHVPVQEAGAAVDEHPAAPARPGDAKPKFDLDGNPVEPSIDDIMAKAAPIKR